MFKNKNRINLKKGSKLYISQKAYNNPYFKETNKSSRSNVSTSISLKTKLILTIFFIFIFSLIWFFLYSKFFLIYDIQINIEKNNDIGGIGEDDIERLAREHLRSKFVLSPGNNIFLFNEQKLRDQININFAFEEIVVEKKLPNKLLINLKEVSYALIWKEQGKYFYITTQGEVIKEVSGEEVKFIFPLIENKGRDLIFDNKITDRALHFQFVIKLYKDLKDTNMFNVENFVIGNLNDNTITMKIVNGPEVYFNVEQDATVQSEKLLVLKNDKLRDDLYNKLYVDLRFGEMIYIR